MLCVLLLLYKHVLQLRRAWKTRLWKRALASRCLHDLQDRKHRTCPEPFRRKVLRRWGECARWRNKLPLCFGAPCQELSYRPEANKARQESGFVSWLAVSMSIIVSQSSGRKQGKFEKERLTAADFRMHMWKKSSQRSCSELLDRRPCRSIVRPRWPDRWLVERPVSTRYSPHVTIILEDVCGG